ncbi:GNAT family N-acetyltransferase [Kribbella aluminosa]
MTCSRTTSPLPRRSRRCRAPRSSRRGSRTATGGARCSASGPCRTTRRRTSTCCASTATRHRSRSYYGPTPVVGVYAVATKPQYRGRGLATSLLAQVRRDAAGRRLTLQVVEGSDAERLYLNAGFRPAYRSPPLRRP